MSTFKISILIATYNRKEELKNCIESILEVDFPKEEYEILIGDGGSNDSTFDYMTDLVKKSKKFPKKYPKIRYYRESKNLGGMGNRIKPLYASKGKYICTLDSDAKVPKDWLKSVYYLMESEKLDVSGSLQITDPKKGPYIGWDLGAHGFTVKAHDLKNPLYIVGVATFFRRTFLLKMGGFDPIMIYGGADMELGIRARLFGAKVLGNVNTIVDHTSPPLREHHRAKKNIRNLIFFLLSRSAYLFLKNFEWRYGINLTLRNSLYLSFISFYKLFKKDIEVFKGYIKGIFWILFNFGTILINHNRVIRKVKSSKLMKQFFHPSPNPFLMVLKRKYVVRFYE